MDKREFMTTGAAAIAAGTTGDTLSREVAAPQYSYYEIEKIKTSATIGARMVAGHELVSLAAASAKNRMWFVADPIGFSEVHGFKVDREFLAFMQPRLLDVDGQHGTKIAEANQLAMKLKLGSQASSGETALPVVAAVAAVAAVVSAVAAVVSAVAITYLAFKWIEPEPGPF